MINLSFIPFKDNYEANNSPSQKIVLTSDDINKGFVAVNFKLPLIYLGEWEGIKNARKAGQAKTNETKKILELYFSYGKEMIKLKDNTSKHSNDLNLHIVTSGYEKPKLLRRIAVFK